MRIIAGKYKRKKLITLPGNDTRPTADRVKENLFNILQNKLTDKCVLDLYSGSGALGIEALSRGAQKIYFVELNKAAIECIKTNLNSLQIEKDSTEIYNMPVSEFLKAKNPKLKESIEIIFADPPYSSEWYDFALQEIKESGLCKNGCMLILEMPSDKVITQTPNSYDFERIDSRIYGKTKIEIWRFQSETN